MEVYTFLIAFQNFQRRSKSSKKWTIQTFVEVTKFISDTDIPYKDYKKICAKTYSKIFGGKIIDIKKLNEYENILNLYYGPTLAFKDFALQLLGNIYDYVLKKINLTVLGATSGDTGSAAIYGCAKSKELKLLFFFHTEK